MQFGSYYLNNTSVGGSKNVSKIITLPIAFTTTKIAEIGTHKSGNQMNVTVSNVISLTTSTFTFRNVNNEAAGNLQYLEFIIIGY